ncbi:predicted protein, partial [Nematostella vectensis]
MLRLELPHIKQEFDWDCGLACVQMVLRRIRGNRLSKTEFEDVCKDLGFGNSVWTIDLASIFAYYGMKCGFFTETLGVDIAYKSNSFYCETFQMDSNRVNRLFRKAKKLGIDVEKRVVSLEEILEKLSSGYVAIALTNSYMLHCDWCTPLDTYSMIMASYCSKCTGLDNYNGHFVIVCGYDLDSKCFYYKNPSKDENLCRMKFHAFESAWHCFGTDSDIVFI